MVAGIYFLCPRKARNTVLLLFSLVFYGWGEPKYILIMLFSTVFDYTNARLIGHFQDTGRNKAAKAVLIVDLVGNLGILGFFKYTDFAIDNLNSLLNAGIPALGLALPIGISFYTFQTMSYTIDVYRGIVKPQKNILNVGAYVTLFPQPGHAALCGGPCQKGADRQSGGRPLGADQRHVRPHRGDGVAGRHCLYLPNLLRFFRIFRYGHWPGASVWFPFSGKL